MSVMVIRIWSFECDAPGCDVTEDIGHHYLPDAVKELRGHTCRWTVVGRGRDAKHYCPKHKPAEEKP